MKKRYMVLIIIAVSLIVLIAPILVDSIFINFTEKSLFSRTTYWKPKISSLNSQLPIIDCSCLGQRLYKGVYYEIYHDSDTSHHGKPAGLIPIIGTRCKFRFILDTELISGWSYIFLGHEFFN